MSKKICLDAGHYGKINVCPAIPEYYESERMWDLHLMLKQRLEEYGFEVITTRPDQKADMARTQRGMLSKGCDLFVSLHSNATAGYRMDETVDYTVAIVQLNGSADAIGEQLAAVVGKTMGVTQGSRIAKRYYDEANKEMDYYAVLRGAAAVGTPGMILEHSFHTNSRIVRWLLDDRNLDKLAQAEARTIAEYFDVLPKEIPTTIEPLAGSLVVTYTGTDGVEVHNTPDFESASINHNYGPVGPATTNGSEFTVTGLATLGDGSKMYQLLSGLYITAADKYVQFTPAATAPVEETYEPWPAMIVDADGLNVRRTPNGEIIKVIHSVTVIGQEPDSDGDLWYKVKLGDGTVGYVWPPYLMSK